MTIVKYRDLDQHMASQYNVICIRQPNGDLLINNEATSAWLPAEIARLVVRSVSLAVSSKRQMAYN